MWKEGPETVLPGSPTNPQMAVYLWLGRVGCSWAGSSLVAQLTFLPIGTSTSGPVDTGGCGKKEVTVRQGGQGGMRGKHAKVSESTQLGNYHCTHMHAYMPKHTHMRTHSHAYALCTQWHMCACTLMPPARAVRFWELGDLAASLHN